MNVENVYFFHVISLWMICAIYSAPGHATYQGMINNFHGNAKYPGVTGPGHWQVEISCISKIAHHSSLNVECVILIEW